MLVVQAGHRVDPVGRIPARFPVEHVPVVRARLESVLRVLHPDGVVAAAAAGADLLTLRAARRQGIPVHVVLAQPVEAFREGSVADQGEEWGARYDETIEGLDQASATLVTYELPTSDNGYREANTLILDRAAALAGTDHVVVLTVRVPDDEHETMTDDFVAQADARGWPVVEIDPSVPPGAPAAAWLHVPDDPQVAVLTALLEDAAP